MANLAALRAAVFSLSAKNLRGGADNRPPVRARVKWPFFRPKRRKQAFIGSRNKRPSSAVLLPDAVARWRGRRALPQSPFGRHEVNIAEKRLDKSVYLSRNGVVLCCIGAVPAIRSVSTVA